VPVAGLASEWSAPLGVVAAAALAAALFASAFVRLRRRGRPDLAPWSRAVLFGLGLALGVLPLVSPLDRAGEDYLLSAHMLQHVLVADAAPALLVLAVRGPLVFFLLPPPALRALAPIRPLRAALRFLLRPGVTFTLWVAVMLGWHAPAAYDYTLEHGWAHDLEHASFVLAGTLAWTQLVDPARHRRLTRPGRMLFAFGLLLLGHPIVQGLLFSHRPVYDVYADQPHRLLGLSPLADQRLAAVVMLVEQLLTFGTCFVLLLRPYVRERRARARLAPESP
jgi:putative membrane protein